VSFIIDVINDRIDITNDKFSDEQYIIVHDSVYKCFSKIIGDLNAWPDDPQN
jgi:hypothetical protein